jgi:hypothetical protein
MRRGCHFGACADICGAIREIAFPSRRLLEGSARVLSDELADAVDGLLTLR